jgi:hypothetical protein
MICKELFIYEENVSINIKTNENPKHYFFQEMINQYVLECHPIIYHLMWIPCLL